MPIISVTLPSDNTSANVADYNVPITTILSTLNGGLDDDNIASLSGTKIVAGTLPQSAFNSAVLTGWNTGILAAPSSVTYNGQRSYTLVFSGVDYTQEVSKGNRIRTTRTTAAPTMCTVLNGTNQYWSKSSPNKMTFTNNFTLTATVELSAYPASSNGYIHGRSDASAANGWGISVTPLGHVVMFGANAGAGNIRLGTTIGAIPLNKEVKIAATWSSGTILIYIDGVLVNSATTTSGTAPTTIVQSGDYAVGRLGSVVANTFFPGKVSQVGVYDAVLSASTIRSLQSQGLTGAESNLKSAYSFNNVATDLNTTTPNDLTNNGTATYATGGGFGNKGVSSTLDYGIVHDISFSTDTTMVVQVPEGCTIPTSGGVSAVDYSMLDEPLLFPRAKYKWDFEVVLRGQRTSTFGGINTWTSSLFSLTVPQGPYTVGFQGGIIHTSNVSGVRNGVVAISNATYAPTTNGVTNALLSRRNFEYSVTDVVGPFTIEHPFEIASAAVFDMTASIASSTGTESWSIDGANGEARLYARNEYV